MSTVHSYGQQIGRHFNKFEIESETVLFYLHFDFDTFGGHKNCSIFKIECSRRNPEDGRRWATTNDMQLREEKSNAMNDDDVLAMRCALVKCRRGNRVVRRLSSTSNFVCKHWVNTQITGAYMQAKTKSNGEHFIGRSIRFAIVCFAEDYFTTKWLLVIPWGIESIHLLALA